MAAALLPLLTSFGPGFLSALLGRGADPQAQLRAQIMQLLSPENQGKMTNQFYGQFLGSPAFQQAQGNIAAGANATQGLLAQHAGAGGFTNSGTGALGASISPSIVGGQQSNLRAAGYGMSQGAAQDSVQRMLQGLYSTSGPSQTRQLFAGGLDAFGPYLQQYLRTQYPKLYGGAPAGGQGAQAPQNPAFGGGMQYPSYGSTQSSLNGQYYPGPGLNP
jgi:hypothetical protein